MTHRNSMDAYRTTCHDERCKAILAELAKGPGTARELKERMGLEDMNQVRPRLTDMGPPTEKYPLRPGRVIEVGHKRCQTTGKNVSVFDLARQPLPIPPVTPIVNGTRSELFNALSDMARVQERAIQQQQLTLGF